MSPCEVAFLLTCLFLFVPAWVLVISMSKKSYPTVTAFIISTICFLLGAYLEFILYSGCNLIFRCAPSVEVRVKLINSSDFDFPLIREHVLSLVQNSPFLNRACPLLCPKMIGENGGAK